MRMVDRYGDPNSLDGAVCDALAPPKVGKASCFRAVETKMSTVL